MNSAINQRNEMKTNAERQSKLLQMQAADAFRKGNFSQMFNFDRKAESSRARAHAEFFEAGLKAINNELNPTRKQTAKAAGTVNAATKTRRIIKIAR